MSLLSIRASLLALAASVLLAACGGSSSNLPAPPVGGLSLTPGDSQVTVSWQSEPGVEYWIFAAPGSNLSLSNWLATAGSTYRLKVTSPYVMTGFSNGLTYSFFMTARVNGGPGGEATPTVSTTPRLSGTEWSAGSRLSTGTRTGLTFGTFVDTATNTVKSLYLSVGNAGSLYKAPDINNWTAVTPLVSSDLYAAGFGFAKFMAAGAAGKVIYSADAQTWTQATSITSENLNAISTNGSIAVAVGNNGSIIKSTDGITWTLAATVPSSAHLYGLAYTVAGTWVAVGAGGTLLTSYDGSNWALQTTGSTANLKAVNALVTMVGTAAGYTYVAVGEQGTVLTSNDAVKWTAQSANTSADLNDMLAINQFIAVGSGGTVITSVDGITWTQQTSNSTGNLTKMLRAENQYLVVDNTGATINSH
ncbi:MAG: hypothetical protein ACOYL0_02285 [Limnohabitans sp.]|nr:hypothetical protein [Burkholderiales bacterium]